MHGYHVLLPLLLVNLLTATTGQRPPTTHPTATSLTSITETSTALDTLLLFDASGSVHSFDRRTGEHHWSSSFGGALISSYSHASQRRRLVPLLGGGVIEVEFARHENNTGDVTRNDQDHHHHGKEEVELEDGSSSHSRSSMPLPLVRLNDRHHLQHTVRAPSQTITRLPLNVRGMVEKSPLPMSTYDAKGMRQTTTVLGQTNTTMFALDLRSGHVGSYVCSDGRRQRLERRSDGSFHAKGKGGDERKRESMLWIGRTDNTLRAFDAWTEREVWNISVRRCFVVCDCCFCVEVSKSP